MNGQEAAPMYESAILYFNMGQLDQALFFIESACKLEPKNKWYQELMATIFLENGQYNKAISSFKKLLEIEPSNKDWNIELASAYLLNNQPRSAIKVYDNLQKYIGLVYYFNRKSKYILKLVIDKQQLKK